MIDMFMRGGRGTRFRSLLILSLAALVVGCDAAERLNSTSDDRSATSVDDATAPAAASFSTGNFKGGIPFGVYHLPMARYGTVFNGSLGVISPGELLTHLDAARRSGTRVMLGMVGSESNFLDERGRFSMSMWKRRVDRFRHLDFSSYVQDGTIIGHYIMDEPHDASNWGGRVISLADVDEMARYSKQLWPSMATIIRGKPDFLKGYKYKYLDAAWAQYISTFGSVEGFLDNYVRDAKASGLALVVGLNQLAGGTKGGATGFVPGKYALSAGQLESWGNALLAEPYACAFISWKYDARYMERAEIKAVMSKLAEKAQNHAPRTCRGAASGSAISEPPPPPPPASGGDDDDNDGDEGEDGDDDGEETGEPPVEGPAPSIVLTTEAWVKNQRHHSMLRWTGATGESVDVYRNEVLIKSTENDGKYTNAARYVSSRGRVSYEYRVCRRATSICSNTSTTSFAK